tara:strand:- start:558 stop:1145 length:588 start_codon:yes stop_codon:yes gene_type:complete
MADPAYIVDGVLTDGEAWVPIQSIEPTADFEWASTDDGQVGDFSQYMDLKIIGYYRETGTANVNTNLTLNFNNASDDFSYQIFRGNGTAVTAISGSVAGRWDPGEGCGGGADANCFAGVVIDIFDINSGKYKSSIASGGSPAEANTGTNDYVTLHASTWESQAPITAIDFWFRYGGTFAAGSRFDLWGVLPRMVA